MNSQFTFKSCLICYIFPTHTHAHIHCHYDEKNIHTLLLSLTHSQSTKCVFTPKPRLAPWPSSITVHRIARTHRNTCLHPLRHNLKLPPPTYCVSLLGCFPFLYNFLPPFPSPLFCKYVYVLSTNFLLIFCFLFSLSLSLSLYLFFFLPLSFHIAPRVLSYPLFLSVR